MKNTWRFNGNELKYLKEVIDSGFGSGTSGNMNQRFEQAFSEVVDAKYAITFNSGTSTLHAALHAVGVSSGDEVIIPPLTVISNLSVVLAQNATPVFADVCEKTFNIDPDDIERKITSKTKAIMPVSLYGLSCDIEKIKKLGEKYNIPIILDAAESYLATCNGKNASKIADICSYSTENSKHIATGDGGIVVTDNEEYAIKMRKFGSLGYAALTSGDGRIRLNKSVFQDPNYKRHDEFALNYRMPEVAAALGLAQTERIEHFVNLRCEIAKMYQDVVDQCDFLLSQKIPDNYRHTYWTYVVRLMRDDISWYDFRDKYAEFGGDGIYAAWALLYDETLYSSGVFKDRCPAYYQDIKLNQRFCPIAEKIQPRLFQFVTNYENCQEAKKTMESLQKTIDYFK